jgi:PKD repeat protein
MLFGMANMAWAQTCSVDCLRVYSIALSDLGTAISGTVKLTDEAVSAGAARSSVVHAVWTRPDGTTLDQYATIGTRLRAEFRLYTAGELGLYRLTVAGATKAGYTFDAANSALLSESIQIGSSGNQAPVAISNANVTSGSAPLHVNFDSGGSKDTDGQIVSYQWTFGDGASSNEQNPAHTYYYAGNYAAKLTVTDDRGATASNTVSVMVTEEVGGCSMDCVSVDRIAMSYKAGKGKVVGRVWLLDENDNPVTDATVHAQWTLPDGSTLDQYRDSGSNARAYFAHEANTAGGYTLRVVDVTTETHTFDPDGSNALEGIINIAP